MADRQRQTFQAIFKGMNTHRADLLPQGQFPLAVNVRADGDGTIRTRPGYDKSFDTGTGGPITDLGSYATLGTDSQPRILAHDQPGHVYLDNPTGTGGTNVGTVGTGGPGASLIPFRPSQSPQSWMYVANPTGYDKFSAPDANNNVTVQKVGIAEPQPMPEAVPDGFEFTDFTGDKASWDPTTTGGQHYVINPNPPPAIVLATVANWIDPVTGQPPPTPAGDVHNVSDVIRSTDSILGIRIDPLRPPDAVKYRYSLHVTGLDQTPPGGPSGDNFGKPVNYQIGEILHFGTLASAVLEDVYPAIQTGSGIVVQSIYYFNDSQAIIVPSQLGFGTVSTTPNVATNSPPTAVLPDFAGALATLRRGSLIQVGGETAFVLNVTIGPTGSLAVEVDIGPGHQPGEIIKGVLALCVSFPAAFDASVLTNTQFTSTQINFVMLKGGLGFLIQELPVNPFNIQLGNMGVPQDNDLFHISLTVAGNPQNFVQLKISFDIDDGTFQRNTLYYAVSESVLQAALNNTQSQFTVSTLLSTNQTVYQAIYTALRQHGYNAASVLSPQNAISINTSTGQVQIIGQDGRLITLNVPFVTGVQQYTELTITLSSLTRTGNNMTRTLADCNAIQIAVITKAFAAGEQMVVGFGSIWVGGGGQPDSGQNGGPYFYRIVGRNSLTGAVSNPTPGTRYGVMPRVQPVFVQLTPSVGPGATPYDPQIDTWDIFRYGGTITSWRYVGSAHVTDQWFKDNIFDSAAAAGNALEFDNYEPWPSVEQPWHSDTVGVTSIDVVGTLINVFGPPSAFPATISKWLTGTLITLNQNTVYTLWNRPIPIPGGGGWQFRIIETAGAMSNPVIFINEPIIANVALAYVWGPDAAGVIYACGDPFRPGSFQPSKPNNPDATPNNAYDLTPTSEPLLGGEIVDGLSLVASSKRWWYIQLSQDPASPWQPVETPAGRGLAAPYGHCTDGQRVYYWAKDSIREMVPHQASVDLTSKDLGNIFPQGETGITIGLDITYAGYTVFAPDYRYAADFRLSVMNAVLRAHYRDRNGTPRTLFFDMGPDSSGQPRRAWSVDQYVDPIVVSFQPAQPPAALTTIGPKRYEESFFADINGGVWKETDLHNDGIWPISAWLSTPEFDGGDNRVRKEWLDSMIDMTTPSGGKLTPVSNGQLLPGGGTIPTATSRSQNLLSLTVEAGEPGHDEPELQPSHLGTLLQWTDNFTTITVPTALYKWTVEFVPQPVEIKTWESDWTSFADCGLGCYVFIYRLRMAYESNGPVTLRIEAQDGISPQPITLPSTGGQYAKTEFVPTANKGMLYQFTATSNSNFAFIPGDSEVVVCAWSRTGPCVKCNLGGDANP